MKKDHPGEKIHPKHKESAASQAKVQEQEAKTAEAVNLQEQLEEKQKEASANYDKYLRAVADLDNYRKRAARERADYIKYANENILRDLLTVYDNMERAREHAGNSRDFDTFLEGLDMIQGQFRELLARYGVETVETKDREFDPNVHEAVMRVPGNAENDNKIVEEYEKGYILNGRLLRPAKVSVAKNTNE